MKIELENGNVVETIETEDSPVRGRRARMCELFDVKGGRDLTEEEEKVVEQFVLEQFKKLDMTSQFYLSSNEELK